MKWRWFRADPGRGARVSGKAPKAALEHWWGATGQAASSCTFQHPSHSSSLTYK